MADLIIDPILGPAFPGFGWVPGPRYILRRMRILRLMKEIRAGQLLEIGPGAGALLIEFSRMGFPCEALEVSDKACKILQDVFDNFGVNVPVRTTPLDEWENHFDVLFAFEVLEHIENDRDALKQWSSWLRPQGKLLFSVPAHMDRWGPPDEWAGHFRRYDKGQLKSLLWDAGLEVVSFECYGFPMANLTERLSSSFLASQIYSDAETIKTNQKRNSDRSGIDRTPHMRVYPLLRTAPGKLLLRIFSGIQGAFIDTDLGNGYLVMAGRK